ncbi:hypothetical protein EV368DRAFT_89783 [Lentinula lateritia]|nr:hypothetical protein EV368DRAFT_89783 [Lentinula lateritia]
MLACFSTLVFCLYDHLNDPIYASTSRLSNPSKSSSSPTSTVLVSQPPPNFLELPYCSTSSGTLI